MVIHWFYLFMGGFLLGVLFMNMESEILLTEEGIFAATEITRLKYLEIDAGEFFPYVLKKRMQGMLIPALLSTTAIGWIAVYGCFIWQGVLTGMIITAAVIRFGGRGLLLILAGIFPHQFLLFPAMIMLLIWCYENCVDKRLYLKNGRKQYVRQAVSLLWICFMVFTGCILESYVNPMLVSDILKIF
ncbi:MAG: stage II sporulation protein M [Lachnospiraceae bacterium]|nr:stage II sporulation protein M [Lachnospiraceae bacterium]